MGPANPYWGRLRRDGAGLALMLAAPLVVSAIAGSGPATAERWTALLLLGWSLAGVLPAALGAQHDPAVESRWRSLPVGAADRFFLAAGAVVPLALVAGVIVSFAGMAAGPAAWRSPLLLAVGVLVSLVAAMAGLAAAAWGRQRATLAGLAALALVLCLVPGLPGVVPAMSDVLPTGAARGALAALSSGVAALTAPAIKLAIGALVLAAVAIAGWGRR